jgi:hypothetical protein
MRRSFKTPENVFCRRAEVFCRRAVFQIDETVQVFSKRKNTAKVFGVHPIF